MAALYEQGATLVHQPGEEPVRGIEAIREALNGLLSMFVGKPEFELRFGKAFEAGGTYGVTSRNAAKVCDSTLVGETICHSGSSWNVYQLSPATHGRWLARRAHSLRLVWVLVWDARWRLEVGSLLPLSSGPTQVGTTPSLAFRAVVGGHGEATVEVTL